MQNMKRIIAVLLASALCFFSFAKELSDEAENQVQKFMQFRMELSAFEKSEDALKAIDDYETQLWADCVDFTPEEKLVLENFVVLEKYNYLYKDEKNRKALCPVMQNQKNKAENWIKESLQEDCSKWLYCTCADLISCVMSFSFNDVLKYGINVRKFYEKAISLDTSFCYASLNHAQWYFWAPGIAGGGRKKAEELFANAYKIARTPAELYYTGIFYSQCLYENGKKDLAKTILDVAYNQFPQSLYVRDIKKYNQEGDSLFEANRKMSKLEQTK